MYGEEMPDLTIIYLTLNKLPESWVAFHQEHLLRAIGNYDIISISRIPMDLGTNLIQMETGSYWNIWKQLLRGARLANTEFVGVAEDDTLYTPEHYMEYRPQKYAVSYNMANFRLYSWVNPPMFFRRNSIGNFSLIGPTRLVIEAIEEREAKYSDDGQAGVVAGEIGRPVVEWRLKVKRNKLEEWHSSRPIINLSHRLGQSHKQKIPGMRVRATPIGDTIPYWGNAEEIIRKFNGR
jgi:hypothetical protein